MKKEKLFTPKEKEVVLHLFNAKTREMISKQMKIEVCTVDSHIKNIHQKTDTYNTAGLIKFIYEHNLMNEMQTCVSL